MVDAKMMNTLKIKWIKFYYMKFKKTSYNNLQKSNNSV